MAVVRNAVVAVFLFEVVVLTVVGDAVVTVPVVAASVMAVAGPPSNNFTVSN